MIYGIFGVNGAGKTLTMTRELTKYDITFTNYNYKGTDKQLVVFNPDTTKLFYQMMLLVKKITVKRIVKEHIKIVLAIDEAGITFPAREWKKMSSEEAYLFAQHRKLGGMDFYYTSQSAMMVDRTLRSNTAISGYPIHFFNIFFVKWYMGISRRKDNLLYITSFIRNKNITDLYDTYEEVESSKFYFSDPAKHIDIIQYLNEINEITKDVKNKKLERILKNANANTFLNNSNNSDNSDNNKEKTKSNQIKEHTEQN